VDKNETQAFERYRKAAEKGHAGAQLCLGYSYSEGLGVSKDLNQAVFWLQKSVNNGEAKANAYLAAAKKKMQEQVAKEKAHKQTI
jgi:TPR repeat protein